ncbi:MAG: hypothetical protein OXC11_02390 [Rhodospirillales bacterium]|nr:hypothetical protein [Rhodospirillales bacterium]
MADFEMVRDGIAQKLSDANRDGIGVVLSPAEVALVVQIIVACGALADAKGNTDG